MPKADLKHMPVGSQRALKIRLGGIFFRNSHLNSCPKSEMLHNSEWLG